MTRSYVPTQPPIYRPRDRPFVLQRAGSPPRRKRRILQPTPVSVTSYAPHDLVWTPDSCLGQRRPGATVLVLHRGAYSDMRARCAGDAPRTPGRYPSRTCYGSRPPRTVRRDGCRRAVLMSAGSWRSGMSPVSSSTSSPRFAWQVAVTAYVPDPSRPFSPPSRPAELWLLDLALMTGSEGDLRAVAISERARP
jgi:hypothetical protein